MTITKIELQKKNKNRASIYIDDEFAFGVHVNVVYDFGLKSGMEIDEDLKQKILSSDAVKQARLYAVKLIDYRPRCEAEVRKKMKEKGFGQADTDETVEYLKENNFLNDEKFARLYIESKLDIKKWGLNRIGYQLHALGVSGDTIDKCLNEYRDSTDEYATALALAEKKLSSLTKDDREARYRKLSGFLGRKGYSYDVISRVIHELL